MTSFIRYQILLVLLFAVSCRGTASDSSLTPAVVDSSPDPIAQSTPGQAPQVPAAETAMTAVPDETPAQSGATLPASPTLLPTTALSAAVTATPEPSETAVNQIRLVPVARGLNRPVYLTHAFDDRLFVVEQPGLIRIVIDEEILPEPFLDIRARVGSQANEQGLLSAAFHPAYPDNGRFFVYYTGLDGATRVSSFQVSELDANLADPDSEQVLLTVAQPFINHNGGQLQFGPDGYLYVGLGDGGSQGDPEGHGQNLQTLLGAILRINVEQQDGSYAIPNNNPFAGSDSARSEIWGYGFRNPWRFSFDRLTSDLFIADVGQNAWEEIHVEPADSGGGLNYGWNILEGSHCYRQGNCETGSLELPVHEYGHDRGCSVTGGYVYRGRQFPLLRGNYFFSDFCSGTIWRLFAAGDGTYDVATVAESADNVSSLGEDYQGELYVLAFGQGGIIWQIQPES